jgi:hypothetical protein
MTPSGPTNRYQVPSMFAHRLPLLVSLFFLPALVRADETKAPLTDAPTNVDELRALEKRVQKVVEKVQACTVGVRIGAAQGSGVIVSADGYVLTAGHVSGLPGRDVVCILPDGKQLKAKTLGRNGTIDSGMIKLEGNGPFPFVEIGKSGSLKRGQWVVSIGHPGGFRPNRTPVVRLGRILYINPGLIRTDCTLVGGDSGGPLFDLEDHVIGIHSRIGGGAITENVHVPVDTFKATWDRLARGDNWGRGIGQQILIQSAGGKQILEKKDSLSTSDPRDRLFQGSFHKQYKLPVTAGTTYTIDLASKKFDAFLRLEDSKGKTLAEDDDGAAPKSNDARIVWTANRDETLTIVATSFEPEQTGTYRLSVLEAETKDPFHTGNVNVLRAVKLPPPVATQIIEKLTGGGLPPHITMSILDDKGHPAAGKEVVLGWTGGKETLKVDADGLLRWKLTAARLKKLNVEVPSGMKALVRITDSEGMPTRIRFAKNQDPTHEAVKSAGGPIVFEKSGTLAGGKGSEPKTYEFKMEKGGVYTVDLESDDFDALLRIQDADGKKLAEDDDGAGFLNSRIVFRPQEDGTFKLLVTAVDASRGGAFRLTVRRADVPAEKK